MHAPPKEWVLETFLDLGVPYDTLLPVLESMFYNDEKPFQGRNRRWIAEDILYLCQRWYADTLRAGGGAGSLGGALMPGGSLAGSTGGGAAAVAAGGTIAGEEQVAEISQLLLIIMQNGWLNDEQIDECRTLRQRVEQLMR